MRGPKGDEPQDITPPAGLRALLPGAGAGNPTIHRHFWSDVSAPESHYCEEVCNGEKWSPGSSALSLTKGCGARRRILKTMYSPQTRTRVGGSRPPDEAWELVDPGRS